MCEAIITITTSLQCVLNSLNFIARGGINTLPPGQNGLHFADDTLYALHMYFNSNFTTDDSDSQWVSAASCLVPQPLLSYNIRLPPTTTGWLKDSLLLYMYSHTKTWALPCHFPKKKTQAYTCDCTRSYQKLKQTHWRYLFTKTI